MKLRALKYLFVFCAISAVILACQKEVDFQDISNNPPAGGGGPAGNNITGTWNFVGMVASTESSLVAGSGSAEEKAVTSYGFISQNNKGTITIDATKFTTNGIAYSIDTVVTTELYLGGVFIDKFDLDFVFDMPPSSASVPYKLVGTDSVYFSSGFLSLDPSAGPTATAPGGSRISWSGDTLILKTVAVENRTEPLNGATATISDKISQIVKLKK